MKITTIATFPIGLLVFGWLIYRTDRLTKRSKEIDLTPTEFIPPKDVSVLAAAAISGKPTRSFSAQLLDLAVRHYIKIYQIGEKGWLKQIDYELEIIKDISTLSAEEREILTDIFESTAVGSKLKLSSLRTNFLVSSKLQDNTKKLKASIAGEYGLKAPDPITSAKIRRVSWFWFVVGALTLSPWLTSAAIYGFVSAHLLKPLTDKGLELSRYLKGLEYYIKAAETDRIQLLQSPEGAQKVGEVVSGSDSVQMVKLYEKVLPYAVLFGLEKNWNKELGRYYETLNQSPDWYVGNSGAFQATSFANALKSFTGSASATSAGSSSSGGSGGGGFSGGGGGGGGGGGW